MKNEIIVNDIKNMIYEVRGKQVMLASDVAIMYNVETKRINEIVKRNIERFPEDFCFQLNKEEFEIIKYQKSLRSQIATLNKSDNIRGMHVKYLPYVFTEYGIIMLSGLLKSEVAIKVNVLIVKAFVEMKKYFRGNSFQRLNNIETKILEHDNEIKLLQDAFDKFKPNNDHLFFEGQIYDAHSLLLDILESSKESIIIIDNYADKKLLDLLSKTKKKVKVYSKNMDYDLIKKYMSQYNNVEITENKTFHDRFIIIDNKDLYHCGASFKELGKKCFCLSKIEDEEIITNLLNKIGGCYEK